MDLIVIRLLFVALLAGVCYFLHPFGIGNGWLAAEHSRGNIRKETERVFDEIIQRRRLKARRVDESVEVIFLVGAFGGFGTGAKSVIEEETFAAAAARQLQVSASRILGIPATIPAKDPDNTFGLAHAVLKETVAESTQTYWRTRH